ncbi:replication protein A 32 kDa subunit [Erpetoichthys calabaricus]|uniref:replication protein A 32 kDa subunit n=1 Tax=Erpetoichthys calabaricus TaxID=27687 RepID=UPI002234851A|nr:replication protein A 32 kDa subunit [Erpetoichthys calabaricus]
MWNNEGFGGGYSESMAGGYTQSPGGFGSPAATQGEKKSRSRAQQIIPCTVSQLLSASQTDEVFRIGDVELSQVSIVGLIRNAEKAPTNILYKVDDMTSSLMDVRQWVDTDEAGSESIVIPPGTYVKVTGHLRSFQGKKSLVAFKIAPLEDMNELISHILEVVQAHMILSKPQGMTSGNNSIAIPARTGMTSMGNSSMVTADSSINGLTAHQSQVLNLIKACRDAQGMNINEIKTKLKGMNMSAIKQAVEFLSNEGHIYSTVDEDHFKSTDGD